jgi:hypothetical protein
MGQDNSCRSAASHLGRPQLHLHFVELSGLVLQSWSLFFGGFATLRQVRHNDRNRRKLKIHPSRNLERKSAREVDRGLLCPFPPNGKPFTTGTIPMELGVQYASFAIEPQRSRS